jgi:hypothetical protein
MDESREVIRLHDEYQIEAKLDYELHRTRRKERYAVEYFFFLPENLDVNEQTYTKKQFYRDMLLYIRFKAPELSLAELEDPSVERSPLRRLRAKLDVYKLDPVPANAAALEYELKILACVLKDALADKRKAFERAWGSHPAEAGKVVTDTLDGARAVAGRFRDMGPLFEDPSLPPSLRSAYGFVDEYVSLLIEGDAHRILQALQDAPSAVPGAPEQLASLIREELEHRRARRYPSIPEDGKNNEVFIFRLGVLKKFVSDALHLSVRTEKEGRGIEQVGLALGAGFAMLFFSAVAFYTQRTYGALSFYFMAAVVVGYMFKDRIKALAQNYVLRFRSDRIMDLSTDLYDPASREKIGACRELVHFVPESRVDPVVVRLRNRDHITEIENMWRAEKVLHYVKEIGLSPRRLDRHSRKSALTDIARFNLRNVLLKMDEPEKEILVLDGGRSKTVVGTRVYHLNLVIKFTDQFRIRYDRVRLVLDRNGIKRVEPVSGESHELPS